ncbi:MAG: DUF72 domain-containing protein [Candidatus Eisenbacteria bacterium]|uniref:DUF72 domain-containing protein n=1 Tax=Eiseniibacteriota bacterium TaxID=2212470 RepID=A0A538TEZ2_UNCEI|nr:MAG: DUF72 domain-containing protein [Candidatus Eisenbacteria bacterium]
MRVGGLYGWDGAMILLGTSGYSYPDWDGVFYPPGLARAKQLDFYVRQFKTVEVNSTYYRIPPPSTFAAMERRSPADFEFVVKVHHDMTHAQTRDPEAYAAFHSALEPLRRAHKLSGVLAQFPQAFHRSEDHERFLTELQERMEGAPLFVEFRHNSWMHEDVFEFLERASLGYVSVDEPSLPGLLPPVARATGGLAYVRFHGRNAKSWYAGDQGKDSDTPNGAPARPARDRRLLRYDYLYSEAELKEWADKIRELNQKTQKTFVFFNNCHAGQAATSAKLMRKLLDMPEPSFAEQTGLL